MLIDFSLLLFDITDTPQGLLRSWKASNSSELYPNYFIDAYFCPILSLLNTVYEANSSYQGLTMQHVCYLRDVMSFQ